MSGNSPTELELSDSRGLRIGPSAADIKQSFLDNLLYQLNRVPAFATKHDLYSALAVTVRDRVFHSSVHTIENYAERMGKFSSDRSIREYRERIWKATPSSVIHT